MCQALFYRCHRKNSDQAKPLLSWILSSMKGKLTIKKQGDFRWQCMLQRQYTGQRERGWEEGLSKVQSLFSIRVPTSFLFFQSWSFPFLPLICCLISRYHSWPLLSRSLLFVEDLCIICSLDLKKNYSKYRMCTLQIQWNTFFLRLDTIFPWLQPKIAGLWAGPVLVDSLFSVS